MSDDEWRSSLRESTAKHAEGAPLDDASWREFAKTIHYQPGDIDRSEDFQGLADRLQMLEGEAETTRVYYLATAPQFYEPVVARSAATAWLSKHTAPAGSSWRNRSAPT